MTVTNAGYYGLLLDDTRAVVDNGTFTLSDQGSGFPSLQFNTSGPTVTVTGTLDLQNGADIGGPGILRVSLGGVLRSVTANADSSVSTVVQLAGKVAPSAGSLTLDSLQPPSAGATTGVLAPAGGNVVLNTVTVPAGSALSSEGTGTTLQGSLTGDGSFRVSTGSFAVDTASMAGAGTTTVAAGASMTVTNAGYYGLLLDDTRAVVDNGIVTLSDQGSGFPSLQFNTSGSTVTVTGTLDLQNGADIGGPGTLTVTTTGTLTKSTGTDQSDVSGAAIENDGIVSSTAGTLAMTGTPAGTSTGSFTSTPAATVTAGGLTLGDGATLAGPTGTGTGSVRLTGTTTIVTGAVVTATGRTGLDDQLTGPGELRVSSGSFAVDTASMSGAGTTTVAAGASMTVTNAGYYGLLLDDTRAVVDNGTVTLSDQGSGFPSLQFNTSGPTVTVTGTLDLQNGADIGGPGILRVSLGGVLRSVTANADSSVSTVVQLAGKVAPSAGSLTLDSLQPPSAGATTGVLAPAGGNVVLNTVTVPAGSALSSEGTGTTLQGSLTGDGSFRVSTGSFAVDTASMAGAGTTTVAAGASMTVTNAGYYGLLLDDTRAVVDNGIVTLSDQGSGFPSLQFNTSGPTVTVTGTLDLQNGADIGGPGTLTVTTTGTLTKSTGTDQSDVSGAAIENDGIVSSTAGTLAMTGTPAGTSTGSFTSTPAATVTAGGLTLGDGATLAGPTGTGTGSVRLTGTTTIVTGAVVTATGRTGLDDQLTGPGALRVSSGSFAVDTASMSGAGTTTVAAGASMTVTNAGYYGLLLDDTRAVVDNGTVTLSDQGSGFPSLQFNTSGPTVTVTGTLDLQNGADIGGPGTLTVTTTGTLTKSTGTDQSDVSTSTDNAGTVRSRAGVLNFSGSFAALSGGVLTKGTYEAYSPGTIALPTDLTRDDATILLDGPSAVISDPANTADGLVNLTQVGPTGSLTVRNGRTQSVAGLTQQGLVTVGPGAASKLTAATYQQTGGSTTLSAASSTLQVTGSTSVTGGSLRGIGTVTTGGSGLAVTASGRLEPGLSGPGTITVSGKLVINAGGTLAVDVNGTAAASSDRVAVSGTAVTNGRIDITTGYTPALGNTAKILTSGGARTGAFTGATGGDLPGDISWAADYHANDVTLRAARPTIVVNDPSTAEGNTGTTPLTFILTQSEPLLTASTVRAYTSDATATVGGPAVGGSDYNAVDTTVTVPFGVTSATVAVPVNGDQVYEHDETMTLNLSTPANLTISDPNGVGTIANDEAVPTLSLGGTTVVERDPADPQPVATVPATLSGVSSFTTTASWATAPGTASAADFTASNGSLSFPPGTMAQSLTVPVTGDATTESDETLTVGLSNGMPDGDVILSGPATVTIQDDDAAVSVAPASAPEPTSGTAPLTTNLTLSHPNPRTVTVNWSTSDGTAVAPGDYVAVAPTQVTFPPGTTSQPVSVTINADNVAEGSETFTINLAGITGGQPGTTSAAMTITSPMPPPMCTKSGTAGNDTLKGTAGDDVLCGLGGNDTILPSGGNDTVYGGSPGTPDAGDDTVSYAGMACPVLVDLYQLTASNADGTGACVGNDRIYGVDNVTGTSGNDTLRGDKNINSLLGGDGDDVLLGDAGNDILNGAKGSDTASYVRDSSDPTRNPSNTALVPAVVDLNIPGQQSTGYGTDTLAGVENLIGTDNNDTLTGDGQLNTLSGLGGDDNLSGGNGVDTLYGLGGTDVLRGGDGVDNLYGGDGNGDVLFGENGTEGTSLSGGEGTGDYCYEANTANSAQLVSGPGCENHN